MLKVPTHMHKASNEWLGSYFVHRLIPSHDAEGRVSGVIVYSINETQQQAQAIEE
ncbi:MAG: hypothetical protein NVS4B7_12040 [Ktedonobacteraceae bacterium]